MSSAEPQRRSYNQRNVTEYYTYFHNLCYGYFMCIIMRHDYVSCERCIELKDWKLQRRVSTGVKKLQSVLPLIVNHNNVRSRLQEITSASNRFFSALTQPSVVIVVVVAAVLRRILLFSQLSV